MVTLHGVNSVWTLGHCTHVQTYTHMQRMFAHAYTRTRCTPIHMHTHNTMGAGQSGPPRHESLRPALQASPSWTLQVHSQLCPCPSHGSSTSSRHSLSL